MNNRMMLPLAALAIAAAACSSSSGTKTTAPSGPAQPTSAAPAATGGATVTLGSSSKLGKILVNAKGQTLYLWQKDNGTTSACAGACASAWPPLTTTGAPTAGAGLTASKLGTTKRSDGTMQVTYGGHPLYTFVQDSSPGDANGEGSNGFGAAWYAVNASGAKVTAPASNPGGY